MMFQLLAKQVEDNLIFMLTSTHIRVRPKSGDFHTHQIPRRSRIEDDTWKSLALNFDWSEVTETLKRMIRFVQCVVVAAFRYSTFDGAPDKRSHLTRI